MCTISPLKITLSKTNHFHVCCVVCFEFRIRPLVHWLPKGRSIRKLMGRGWGGAKYKKKYSRKGKLNDKKNSCTPINPKKYSCYGLKKFIQGIWWRKKIPAARKFPSPSPSPHNFSNGPSLRAHSLLLAVHGMFQHVQHKEPPNYRKPNY